MIVCTIAAKRSFKVGAETVDAEPHDGLACIHYSMVVTVAVAAFDPQIGTMPSEIMKRPVYLV